MQPSVRSGPAIIACALNFVRAAMKPMSVPRSNTRKRPLKGQFALNVDASFSADDQTGSCSAVIRDCGGMVIAASTAMFLHVPDIVFVEAAALVERLKLAQNIGCNYFCANG